MTKAEDYGLTPIEYYVLWHRHGPQAKTLQEIADLLGIPSRERVRMINQEALFKLARYVLASLPEPERRA